MSKHRFILLVAVGSIVAAVDACDDPYTPVDVDWTRYEPEPPSPPPAFPAAAAEAEIYAGQDTTLDPSNRTLMATRYLFNPTDSTFALQFSSALTYSFLSGFHEYTGHYVPMGPRISFRFEPIGDWWGDAEGSLRGDTLTVEYGIGMYLDGFKDGVYVRTDGSEGTTTETTDASADESSCSADIFLADSDGSDERLIVSGEAPAWSPDGQRIAFHRTSGEWWRPENGEIYVIDADGTGERRLGRGLDPSWSPEGRRIAFTATEGIAVMGADGTDVTALLAHDFLHPTDEYEEFIGEAAWSPDGAHIAFEHQGDADATVSHQIFVMEADGSNPRRLTPDDVIQYAEEDPAWSPDGSRIAFWSYGYGVAVVPAAGGVPSSLFEDGGYHPDIAWSPNGSGIVFTSFIGPGSPCADRREITKLGGGTLLPDAFDAAWSPDGGTLAFARVRG